MSNAKIATIQRRARAAERLERQMDSQRRIEEILAELRNRRRPDDLG